MQEQILVEICYECVKNANGLTVNSTFLISITNQCALQYESHSAIHTHLHDVGRGCHTWSISQDS